MRGQSKPVCSRRSEFFYSEAHNIATYFAKTILNYFCPKWISFFGLFHHFGSESQTFPTCPIFLFLYPIRVCHYFLLSLTKIVTKNLSNLKNSEICRKSLRIRGKNRQVRQVIYTNIQNSLGHFPSFFNFIYSISSCVFLEKLE